MGRFIDLTGRRFGMLLVLHRSEVRRNDHVMWRCKCDCGNEKIIVGGSLRQGASKSCGCTIIASNISRSVHGMTKSPEFKARNQIIQRCTNPSATGYENYGGRGITVCERWASSFQAFFDDLGPRPSPGFSVERLNCNGNYEPENCVWADRQAQALNTRASRTWTVSGVSYPSTTAAALALNVSPVTVLRWCNGFHDGRRYYPPKPNCFSVAKYGEQP